MALVKGFSGPYFMPSSVIGVCEGFVIIIMGILGIYAEYLKKDAGLEKVDIFTTVARTIVLILLVILIIINITTRHKEREIETLTEEWLTTTNQDYQVWIKKKNETEWRLNDNHELRPEVELTEVDLQELLEDEFHTKVSLYEGENSIIFSLGTNLYRIQKEGDKKICTLYKIENGTEQKRDLPNALETVFYEDKSRGVIITKDQIRDLKLENANL